MDADIAHVMTIKATSKDIYPYASKVGGPQETSLTLESCGANGDANY